MGFCGRRSCLLGPFLKNPALFRFSIDIAFDGIGGGAKELLLPFLTGIGGGHLVLVV